jgi:hypothetical protein
MVLPCLSVVWGSRSPVRDGEVLESGAFLFCDWTMLLSIGSVVTLACMRACLQKHRACMCMRTYWVFRRP